MEMSQSTVRYLGKLFASLGNGGTGVGSFLAMLPAMDRQRVAKQAGLTKPADLADSQAGAAAAIKGAAPSPGKSPSPGAGTASGAGSGGEVFDPETSTFKPVAGALGPEVPAPAPGGEMLGPPVPQAPMAAGGMGAARAAEALPDAGTSRGSPSAAVAALPAVSGQRGQQVMGMTDPMAVQNAIVSERLNRQLAQEKFTSEMSQRNLDKMKQRVEARDLYYKTKGAYVGQGVAPAVAHAAALQATVQKYPDVQF